MGSRRQKSTLDGGGYRWTCPYCGTSRVNVVEDEAGQRHALTALRTHITASDGAEHGPRNELPTDFDEVTLSEHVERVDGRG